MVTILVEHAIDLIIFFAEFSLFPLQINGLLDENAWVLADALDYDVHRAESIFVHKLRKIVGLGALPFADDEHAVIGLALGCTTA